MDEANDLHNKNCIPCKGGIPPFAISEIHKYLKKAFPNNWLNYAMNGGEDYELLFTVPSDLIKKISEKSKAKITVNGKNTKATKIEIINKTNLKVLE